MGMFLFGVFSVSHWFSVECDGSEKILIFGRHPRHFDA
jgi:hypothetical protein